MFRLKRKLIMKMVLFALLATVVTNPFPILAQNIVIKSIEGTEQSIALDSLSKLTFDNDNLVVNCHSGDNLIHSLATIRKIYFKDVPVGVEDYHAAENTLDIIIYPNPVQDILTIQNLPENITSIEIYGLEGNPVTQVLIYSGNVVDVSSLASGAYFIKLNNHIINFIKL